MTLQYDKALSRKQDMRSTLMAAVASNIRKGLPLIVLVSDSTSTAKVHPFLDDFPDRIIDVGIAEQNLVGVAAGLSLDGFIPITANAAPFLVGRANEQIKNDICYSETNVKMIGLNAGVSYGPLASTHHSIDDISILRGFGNVSIFAPCDGPEAAAVLNYVAATDSPAYVRLDNSELPVLHNEGYVFRPGKIDILGHGDDLAIFAMGSMVAEAYLAAQQLELRGLTVTLVNFSSIRPHDTRKIEQILQRCGKAVTVEEHSVHGGIGSLIAEIISESALPVILKRIGIPEGQFSVSGPREEIRTHYGLHAQAIVDICKSLCNKSTSQLETQQKKENVIANPDDGLLKHEKSL